VKRDFGDHKHVGAMGRRFSLRRAPLGEFIMRVGRPDEFAISERLRPGAD